MQVTTSSPIISRQIDIDALRMFGTMAVFLYHCARYFNLSDWHVKNNDLSALAHLFVIFTGQWLMPLFFILSGVGTFHALKKRSSVQFIAERSKRLVIPLLIGSFIILIPVQVYIERITHGQFSGSFWEFYPEYFNGFYGFGGNFAWMGLHLWYLEILFVFSLICLPVFTLLKFSKLEQWLDSAVAALSIPWGYLLPAVLIIPAEVFNNTHLDTFGIRDFGGWGLLSYLTVFILGYGVMSRKCYRYQLIRYWKGSFITGCILFGSGYYLFQDGFTDRVLLYSVFRSLNLWVWLCALVGVAGQYATPQKSSSGSAQQGIMPFYILHQTVIVVLGYLLLMVNLPNWLKFFILVLSSFVVIIGCYQYLIRPFTVMRILFGMKGRINAS